MPRLECVIKLVIHFSLISLDTSLRPDSAIYSLPAIFERAKRRTVYVFKAYLSAHLYPIHPPSPVRLRCAETCGVCAYVKAALFGARSDKVR